MKLNSKTIKLSILSFIPIAITFLLFILFIIPKHIWGINHVMPILPLIPIFYWGRLKNSEIPYWFVFLIGLLVDIVNGTPFGLSALLYLSFLAILHTKIKHLHKEGFTVVWIYFIIIFSIVIIFQWLAMSFYGNQFHAILPVLIQWLLTIGCYPVCHKLFDRLLEYMKQYHWVLLHG